MQKYLLLWLLMKTNILVFCDSSTIKHNDKSISKMSSIYFYQKKSKKVHIEILEEEDNNIAELMNLIKTLFILDEFSSDFKKNHPIIIYNDCRYAIDTMNQFLSYVKKMRGIPELLDYYKEYKKCKFEKTNRYYAFKICEKRILRARFSPSKLIFALMHLMDTNKISFKWIPREENTLADMMSKSEKTI